MKEVKDYFLYQPKYEKFFVRMLSDYSIIFTIIALVIINLQYLIFDSDFLIILLINIIVIGFNLIILFRFIFFVKKIKLKEHDNKIEIEVYRFDKLHRLYDLDLCDIEVKIIDHFMQRHTTYSFVVLYKKRIIIKQHETAGWSKNVFIDIKSKIDLMKTKNKLVVLG